MKKNIENWKDVVGWVGYYEVSDTGKVRSKNRIVLHKNGFRQTISEKVLLGTIGSNGYRYVDLCAPGTRKNCTVHSLVALAFLGPRPPGYEVCHTDGNRLNNNLSNLRYGTRQDNVNDTMRHGNVPRGDRHWNAKIPDSDVGKILASSESITETANRYGVSFACIYDIKKHRRRKYVPVMKTMEDEIDELTDKILEFA